MINGIRLDEQRVTVYDDMRSQIQQTDTESTAVRVNESAQNVLKAPEMAENQAAAGGVNAAVQKALEEAGLPKNERNSGIVRQMLENQMSIDKDSLSRVVQQANMFREADISTLLLMNKNAFRTELLQYTQELPAADIETVGQTADVLFTSELGYTTTGSGQTIPPYSPLLFELEVVKQ